MYCDDGMYCEVIVWCIVWSDLMKSEAAGGKKKKKR